MAEFSHSFLADGSPQTWTNMLLAATEFRGFTHNRKTVNLTGVVQACLRVYVDGTAGISGSYLRPQYSTDNGSNWAELAETTTQLDCVIDSTGSKTSGFHNIVSGARGDVLIRLIGAGGDGARDPIFGDIELLVKKGE